MSLGASTLSRTGGAGFSAFPQAASAGSTRASASALARIDHRELDPSTLETLGQRLPHRLSRRHLPRRLRQLVARQAEARLGEHLRRLAVAGIPAADLTHDALSASLAVEADAEPRLRPLLLVRPSALWKALHQEVPRRRDLRECDGTCNPDRQRDRLRQVLDGDVVAVSEIGAIALERSGGAHDDLRIDRRERQHPAVDVAVVAGTTALSPRDAATRPRL